MNNVKDPTRQIKLAKRVWRYDEVLTTWGWKHDVYYDRDSDMFIIHDFPEKGLRLEIPALEDGKYDMRVGDKIYKVRVFEE